MNRRQFLSMIWTSSVFILAGCIDGIGEAIGSSGEPEGMDTSTLYVEADVFTQEISDREIAGFDWREEDHTIISDAETAEEAFIANKEIDVFLEETDFTESYLLVIQNGMQSQMKLTLDMIEQTTDGLVVNISIEGPDRPNDDLGTHSLLIRITDEEGEVPEEVNANIEGYV